MPLYPDGIPSRSHERAHERKFLGRIRSCMGLQVFVSSSDIIEGQGHPEREVECSDALVGERADEIGQ